MACLPPTTTAWRSRCSRPNQRGPARDPRSGDPPGRASAREGGRSVERPPRDRSAACSVGVQVQAEAATTWRSPAIATAHGARQRSIARLVRRPLVARRYRDRRPRSRGPRAAVPLQRAARLPTTDANLNRSLRDSQRRTVVTSPSWQPATVRSRRPHPRGPKTSATN
jgi:hypothetical protein